MISAELLAELYANLDLGLCAWRLDDPDDDRSLRLIAGNPASERIMGARFADCVGRRIDDAFPLFRALGLPAVYAQVVRTGQAWHTERLQVGEGPRAPVFSVRAFPLRDRGVGVLFADTSARVRAETALAAAEARQRALLEALPDTLYEQRPDGTLRDALRGVPGPAWLADRLCALEDGDRVFETEVAGVDWEVRVVFADRRYVMVRDISERRRAERSKNELVGIVAHELRTPLTSIHGALALIEGGVVGPVPAAMHELLAVARSNTDRLSRLIDDLLDLDRLEAGMLELRMVPLDADALVDTAIESVRGSAEYTGVRPRRVSGSHLGVLGDPDRVLQVLTNLLSNAVRFSPAQATIGVSVEPAGDRVRFTVRDQGPGVPPDKIDRLFRRFSQLGDPRGRGGTGLGLAISKAIVEGHGGQIGYTRADGSAFWFELPAAPVNPRPVVDLFADLRVAYVAALPEQVERLSRFLSVASFDPDEAQKIAHKLHGTGGTYGLTTLSEAAGRIEEALRSGRHAALVPALADLRTAVTELTARYADGPPG